MEYVLGVLDEAMAVQGAVSGKVRLIGEQSGKLELLAQRGLSERFAREFASVRPDDPAPSAVAFSTRQRVFVADVANDAKASLYSDAGRLEGFAAMVSTPIFGVAGHVIGAMSTHFAQPPVLTSLDGVVLDYCATRLARVLDARFGRR